MLIPLTKAEKSESSRSSKTLKGPIFLGPLIICQLFSLYLSQERSPAKVAGIFKRVISGLPKRPLSVTVGVFKVVVNTMSIDPVLTTTLNTPTVTERGRFGRPDITRLNIPATLAGLLSWER